MKRFSPLVLLIFLLGGCATNQAGLSQKKTLYFPSCYLPLQQARHLDSKAKSVAEGAGKGALIGVLAGAAGGAVSALFTGKALNIVSGAAIGAAAGGVAGGVQGAATNNEARKNELLSHWYEEIDGDIDGLGFNGAAATVSLQCYDKREAETLEKEKEGKLSANAARSRLAEISQGRQEANALLMSDEKP